MRPKLKKAASYCGHSKQVFLKKVISAPQMKKTGSKLTNGVLQSKSSRRKSRRSHIPVKKFEIENELVVHKTGGAQKRQESLPIYLKGECLAIRNETGSFYLCITQQNVFEKSPYFSMQWLNNKTSPTVYETDFYDKIDVQSILRDVHLKKLDKNKYELPDGENEKIKRTLDNSVKAEKGEEVEMSEDEEEEEVKKSTQSSKKSLKKRKSNATADTLISAGKLKRTVQKKRKLSSAKADDKGSKKAKVSVKTKKTAKPKPAKPDKLKNASLPKNFDIKVLDKDPYFDTKEMTDCLSILADSRLALKAVRTKDYKLLKKAINDVEHVAEVSLHRSCHVKENAFTVAILREDLQAYNILSDYLQSDKRSGRISFPSCNVPVSDTGVMDVEMLGHATASISAARGSREGNQAFTLSDTNTNIPDQITFGLKRGVSFDFLNVLAADKDGHNLYHMNRCLNNLYLALRNGHADLAKKLIDAAVERSGFGMTEVFQQALVAKPNFSKVRPTSVVKKATENRSITPLHCAAVNPNSTALSKLIAIEQNLTIADADGYQVIHYAAASKTSQTTRLLIDAGVNIEAQTKKFQKTPLHIACKLGNVDTIEALLKRSVKNDTIISNFEENVNTESKKKVKVKYVRISNMYDKKGFLPLHLAAKHGQAKAVEAMLKYSIHIEKKTKANRECMTALILASQQGHLQTVKVLVENGAKLEMGDRRKKTALVHAVMNGQTHVASYLLHQGANPKAIDSSGNTLVHYAAAYCWMHCLQLVLEAGADPALPNAWKYPPVSIAMLKKHPGIVRYLLDLPEVDVDFVDNNGKTLLMHLMETYMDDDAVKQADFLINEKKSKTGVVDDRGNTCLHYLALKRYNAKQIDNVAKIGKFIFDSDCPVNAFNSVDKTALHYALSSSNGPIIDLLLERNAVEESFQQCKDGQDNFLHFMVSIYDGMPEKYEMFKRLVSIIKKNRSGNLNIAQLIKMANMRNEDGLTPLHALCKKIAGHCSYHMEQNHVEMLRLFLKDFKCDPNIVATKRKDDKEDSLMSAVHYVVPTMHVRPLEVLVEYGADLNKYNNDGETPLHTVMNTNFETFYKLIDNGADVNLWTKIKDDDDDKEPTNPLLAIASQYRFDEKRLKYLIDNGADVNVQTKKTNSSVLHILCSQSDRTDSFLDIIKLILDHDANVNAVDDIGRQPLHHAMDGYYEGTDSRSDLEELLIEYNADPHAKDKLGRLPLHYTFMRLNGKSRAVSDPIEMASILVNAMDSEGCDECDVDGCNPLHYAARCGASVSCVFLCHKVKDINAKNNEGNTALGIAAMHNLESTTLMLLQKNADINVEIVKSTPAKVTTKETEYLHPVLDEVIPEKSETQPLLQEIVRRDWQGVLYTVLLRIEEETGDFNNAIEAALMENKFNLALKLIRRSRKTKKLCEKRKHGHNFLHRLAIGTKSSDEDFHERHLLVQITNALLKKGLSLTDVDDFNATPLIYAVQNHNVVLCKHFVDVMKLTSIRTNIKPDVFGRTIMSAAVWNQATSFKPNFKKWMKSMVANGFSLSVLTSYPALKTFLSFKYPLIDANVTNLAHSQITDGKIHRVSPLICSMCYEDNNQCAADLIFCGADLNFTCQAGITPLMYAVILNDVELVKLLLNVNYKEEYKEYLKELSKLTSAEKEKFNSPKLSIHKMVKHSGKIEDELTDEDKHFKMKANINLQKQDKKGKTVIHYLINHYDGISFDNLRILQLLICVGFKASNQEWKNYLELAEQFGAVDIYKFLKVFTGTSQSKKMASNFSVNDRIHWPHANTYSYEEDAKKAVTAIDPQYFEPDYSVKPNPDCDCHEQSEVLKDLELDAYYSVKMQKFDVDYGIYGFYNFYMMQVVHDTVKDLYMLFTKWGRIGRSGQWQNTPFPSSEEAIKEFCKIFKAKSGNDWENIAQFKKHPFKYHLVQTAKKKEVSIRDMNIDLMNSNAPPSKLPLALKKLLQQFSDIKMLKSGWRHYKIDSNLSPFGMLDLASIHQGEQILEQIRQVQTQIKTLSDDLRSKSTDERFSLKDYHVKSSNFHQEIETLSEQVFSLLPILDYNGDCNSEPLMPLFRKARLEEVTSLVEQLLEFDITSKICMGAFHRINEVNPMDYIYRSIECKLELLSPDDKMSLFILQAIHDKNECQSGKKKSRFYDEEEEEYVEESDDDCYGQSELIDRDDVLQMSTYNSSDEECDDNDEDDIDKNQLDEDDPDDMDVNNNDDDDNIDDMDADDEQDADDEDVDIDGEHGEDEDIDDEHGEDVNDEGSNKEPKKESKKVRLPKKYLRRVIKLKGCRTKTNQQNECNSEAEIVGIYKVEQTESQKKFEKLDMPNRKLLWHGTKLENAISILSRGLRVSPVTAFHTGQVYGKGIYFSDSFNYSLNYASDGSKLKVMFLCEVALGENKDYNDTVDNKEHKKFDSVHISSSETPMDISLSSPYGSKFPIYFSSSRDGSQYVIPNKDQVCIRYMVLAK